MSLKHCPHLPPSNLTDFLSNPKSSKVGLSFRFFADNDTPAIDWLRVHPFKRSSSKSANTLRSSPSSAKTFRANGTPSHFPVKSLSCVKVLSVTSLNLLSTWSAFSKSFVFFFSFSSASTAVSLTAFVEEARVSTSVCIIC